MDDQGNNYSLASGTDVAADSPLPVPDNVDISSATTFDMPQGRSFGLIFDIDPARADEITKLYKDSLSTSGLNVEDSGGGPDGVAIIGDNGDYWECSISWTPL